MLACVVCHPDILMYSILTDEAYTCTNYIFILKKSNKIKNSAESVRLIR